tara:strand:- start:101 stop:346 length:246 start_codon:yes stop_codon:yes gene_type:complete
MQKHPKTFQNEALEPPKSTPEHPETFENQPQRAPRREESANIGQKHSQEPQNASKKRPRAKNSANMVPTWPNYRLVGGIIA